MSHATTTPTPPTPKHKPWMKLVIVVLVLGVLIGVANHFGVFDMLKEGTLRDRVTRLDGFFAGLGIWAQAVFILIWILTCVLLLPGLPITIVGGLIFGAFWGSVWTAIGSNLGALAAFLIGRYAARDMVSGWVENNKALKKIDDGVREQGWRMLMVTRLVPLFPFNLQNYVYGLTDISTGTYALVTFICMLPAIIAFNFAAGSAREVILAGGQPEAVKRTVIYLAVAALLFVLISLIPGWLKKRSTAARDLTKTDDTAT